MVNPWTNSCAVQLIFNFPPPSPSTAGLLSGNFKMIVRLSLSISWTNKSHITFRCWQELWRTFDSLGCWTSTDTFDPRSLYLMLSVSTRTKMPILIMFVEWFLLDPCTIDVWHATFVVFVFPPCWTLKTRRYMHPDRTECAAPIWSTFHWQFSIGATFHHGQARFSPSSRTFVYWAFGNRCNTYRKPTLRLGIHAASISSRIASRWY